MQLVSTSNFFQKIFKLSRNISRPTVEKRWVKSYLKIERLQTSSEQYTIFCSDNKHDFNTAIFRVPTHF